VIVNAAEESQSIRGLDRRTGREVWKAEAAALELAYGTPAIADGRLYLRSGQFLYCVGESRP
jgi:outer membrane protein assembly factor BamB